MTGLDILALVCNIVEVIRVIRETTSLCKKIYHTGSGVDPELAENATILGHISSQIRALDTNNANARSTDEDQLHVILGRCQDASQELRKEVVSITGHAKKGSLASTLKIAVKTHRRKRRLEKLERTLEGMRKLMVAGFERKITKQETDSNSVDSSQKTSDGTKAYVQLLLHEHHTSQRNVAERRRQKDRDRLLKSLTFPGMNERRQQVSKEFPQTFRWAFGDDREDSNEEDIEGNIECTDSGNEDRDGGEEDMDSNDDGINTHDPERNTENRLKRYQVLSNFEICETSWDSFGDWLRSDSPVYWISGKPGSGKTTLVKYFLSSKRTRRALDVWNSGAVLLSHFFWRPGSAMQQNIKGLLCSLLYQLLLQAKDAIVDDIISQNDDVARKETDTDWSVRELSDICLQTLRNFGKPLCIFVDGLDELDPRDGILELFDLLDTIQKSPSTKMCLSSRPESPIEKRLRDHPQLRMQDLIRDDLRKYAHGNLKFPICYSGNQYEAARDDIIGGLVKKSEGVFLWLCLAVKSLNLGLDNEDSLEDVLRRTESLPPDLARLYKDMWKRFDSDHTVYRQSAAFYLRLVIASLKAPWYTMSRRPACLIAPDLTVLEMAIAMASPEIRPELGMPTTEKLVNACDDTIHLIPIRCAGLLEIVTQKGPGECGGGRDPVTRLERFGNGSTTIRFIHRTAFDFLTDTADGRDILSADATSQQSLYLKLFGAGLSVRHLLPDLDTIGVGSVEIYTRELSRIWLMGSSALGPALDAPLQDMATYLEFCGSSGFLKLDLWRRHKSERLERDEFLAYAAFYGLSKYVMKALAKQDTCTQVKSDVLLHILAGIGRRPHYSQDDIALVVELLQQGADPNYKGCILFSGIGSKSTVYHAIATPFSSFLVSVLSIDMSSATETDIQRLCHVMVNLLRHGANISELVNLSYFVPDSGGLVFLSLGIIVSSCLGPVEYRDTSSHCILLVPAYIILDALVYRLEDALSKTTHSKEECCDLNHVAAIADGAKLIGHGIKPRIIALRFGSTHRRISNKDSDYLSDDVLKILTNLRSENAKALVRDRFSEVFQRSKSLVDIVALLEEEGLLRFAYEISE